MPSLLCEFLSWSLHSSFFVDGLRAMLLQAIQPYANEVVVIAIG
jgi:hypothetical protein